jgi:hypothetical protein
VETIQSDRYEPIAGRLTRSCDALFADRKLANPKLHLHLTDWLRLDVGLASSGEIYSWAGAPKFEEREIDELVPQGAIGTGPFATMLMALFENRDPRFVFEGDAALDKRRVLEYSFIVPKEESHYRVKMPSTREWIITGYTGTVMVDPKTSELVRFTVRTEQLPEATGSCEIDSTLDYGMVSLEGFEYLLPKTTRQRFFGRDGEEAENRISFASCREFRGESTLSFGTRESASDASRSGSAARRMTPGLPVAIELTGAVTFAQFAAGDRIEGRLAEPIRDAQGSAVLAPAGAKVEGRIMRLELHRMGAGEYVVALRWETVEVEGVKLPLALKPNRQTDDARPAARGTLQRRGIPIELPQPGEERYGIYRYPGQKSGIESGSRTEWVTIEP